MQRIHAGEQQTQTKQKTAAGFHPQSRQSQCGGSIRNLISESAGNIIRLAHNPEHNVCVAVLIPILRAIVRLRLAIDKPNQGGIARHVEPRSKRPSSSRAVGINLRNHGIVVVAELEMRCSNKILWIQCLTEVARRRVEVNKRVLVALDSCVKVL